jgi:hypothetical protein
MESGGHSEVVPVHLGVAVAKGRVEIRGVAQIPVLQERDKDWLRRVVFSASTSITRQGSDCCHC